MTPWRAAQRGTVTVTPRYAADTACRPIFRFASPVTSLAVNTFGLMLRLRRFFPFAHRQGHSLQNRWDFEVNGYVNSKHPRAPGFRTDRASGGAEVQENQLARCARDNFLPFGCAVGFCARFLQLDRINARLARSIFLRRPGASICCCLSPAHAMMIFTCPIWFEHCLAVIGVCCLQEAPARWVVIHRRHHHHADEAADPHSPLVNFFWSHMGWLMLENRELYDLAGYHRYARDILRDPFYRTSRTPFLFDRAGVMGGILSRRLFDWNSGWRYAWTVGSIWRHHRVMGCFRTNRPRLAHYLVSEFVGARLGLLFDQ